MAGVLVVTCLSWLSFQVGKNQPGEELIAAFSQQHETQKQFLLIQFQDEQAATENWQQQLNELEEAAQAIKKVLAQEPNNAALIKMLRQVYAQEISLIERVHAPTWQTT